MRGVRVVVPAVLSLLLLAVSPAAGEEPPVIGSVRTVGGKVTIHRGEQTLPAQVGARIHEGDLIETGERASVGIVFRDEATLSLGPGSWVIVDRYLFAPAEGKFAFVTRILRGTAAYLSGLIARLAPGTAVFETPVATIGVRGTHLAVRVSD